MKIQDNFHKLRWAIQRVASPERTNILLSGLGGMVKEVFMAELEQVQPVDTSMAFKPSIRRGYTPIASGWGPGLKIEKKLRGVSLILESTSQHINIQRFGTEKKNYPIPTSPSGVYFWWGSPLPWAPTRIPELMARAPGMFFFPQITHPGIEAYGGSDFVHRAWMAIRARVVDQYRDTMKKILFQPFRDMG